MRTKNYIYNKRVEQRTHYPVQLRLSGRGEQQRGLAINISSRGALIDAPGTYRRGDKIRIHFDTDLATLPAVFAQVIRTEPAFHGMRSLLGVRFEKPNAPLMDIVKLKKRLAEGTRK